MQVRRESHKEMICRHLTLTKQTLAPNRSQTTHTNSLNDLSNPSPSGDLSGAELRDRRKEAKSFRSIGIYSYRLGYTGLIAIHSVNK